MQLFRLKRDNALPLFTRQEAIHWAVNQKPTIAEYLHRYEYEFIPEFCNRKPELRFNSTDHEDAVSICACKHNFFDFKKP